MLHSPHRLQFARSTILRTFVASRAPECKHDSKPQDASTSMKCKVHRAQLNNLILAADRLLESKHAHSIESYLMSRISANKFYNSYRWVAFTRLIRFALSRQLYSVAIALYNRLLNEGFAPLSSIRARITALKVVDSSKNIQDALVPLRDLFTDGAYDNQSFLQLLYFMLAVKRASVQFIEEATHAYLLAKQMEACSCPDIIGAVVSINIHAGRLGAGQRWLRAFEDSCKTADDKLVATPHAEMLETLMRVDPRNTPALRSVLEDMRVAGIPPNVSIFNTLMRVNAKQQRYQEVFELYRMFMQRRCENFMPNDVTFKIVLRAVRLIGQNRRAKRPPNAIEPRQIFRDMLESHLQQTEGQPQGRSTSLSASALQSALRTFITRADYLGAFIVVRLLDIFGFSADLRTYQIILAHLLSRIRRESKSGRRPGEYCLADFLLYLRPDETPDLNAMVSRIQEADLTSTCTSATILVPGHSRKEWRCDVAPPEQQCPPPGDTAVETVTHLLALGEPQRLNEEDLYKVTPSTSPSTRTKGRRPAPTVSMLVDVGELPLNHRYSSVPLARLLQKVFLGAIWAGSSHASKNWHYVIEKAVGDARKRMVPDIAPVDPGRAAKLHQHLERKQGLPFIASRRRRSARAGWEIDFVGEDDRGT
ncbi:hypothetical protein V8B97DRAFT_1962911 [Scleroderma yunnanense]